VVASRLGRNASKFVRSFSEKPPPSTPPSGTPKFNLKNIKTTAGTGRPVDVSDEDFARHRGPVSWAALFLVAVASATAVGYYKIERERRLERAMGKVVSSTYRNGTEDEGWSPNPEFLVSVDPPMDPASTVLGN
jgi:hypothetical protein